MKGFNNRLLYWNRIFSKDDLQKLNTNKQWLWWLGMVIATALILIVPTFDLGSSYKSGEIAESTIYYEGTPLTYMSDVKYQQAKDAIEKQVSPVYILDEQKVIDAKGRIGSFIGEVVKLKANKEDDHTTAYKNLLGNNYSSEIANALATTADEGLYALEAVIGDMLNKLYVSGVKASDFDLFRKSIDDYIDSGSFTQTEKIILQNYVDIAALEPNSLYDKDATKAIISSKQNEIKPIEVTVRPGQIIVQRGTTITDEQLEILDKTGLLSANKGIFYYPGVLLLVLVFYYLIYVYCRRYFPYYAYDKEGVRLLATFLVAFVLFCEVIMLIATNMTGVLYSVLGYLLPLPALAIIFTTLAGQRFSYFVVSAMSLFVSFLTLNQPSYAIVALVSSLFTVHIVGRVRERYQLISFGFYIGLINAILILALGLVGGINLNALFAGIFVGLVSGYLSSLLALGVLPLAETLFKMTTPMKLLELANPGHPLIKRLMTEAPGTYYHSVLVGNLAEAGAEVIGADANLVRVASYFHDVGKLERPKYFVENQEPNRNPHEKLNPTLSTLIITSHVKDGVEMVESYDFPKSVVNIINEHHGNGVVRYFYHKAKAGAIHSEDIHEDDFRYPHPKPQTKESAVLMMADCVQAALQSCGAKTRGDMRAKIHDIIQGLLAAGQFEECDLTFRDLHKVQEAFFSVLSGLSHYRIEYPTLMENDAKELEKQLAAQKKEVVSKVKGIKTENPTETWISPHEGVGVDMDAPPTVDSSLVFPKITDIEEDVDES